MPASRPQVGQGVFGTITEAAEDFFSFRAPVSGPITRINAWVDTAPSGGDLVFDVKVNGTTIYADPGDQLTILDGEFDAEQFGEGANFTQSVSVGELISVDLDTVPSAVGNKLYISIQIGETGALLNDEDIEFEAVKEADKMQTRTLTGITPSATPDTYGSIGDPILPHSDIGFWGPVIVVILTAGGSFGGGETLTVRITVEFDDASEQEVTKTFTATGEEMFDMSDMFGLMQNSRQAVQYFVDCKSSISSSSATAGCKFGAYGGGDFEA